MALQFPILAASQFHPIGPWRAVYCKCGHGVCIQDNHLEEISAGVWGFIKCPGLCGKILNDSIKEASKYRWN